MKYKESQIDKKLKKWFYNDLNHKLLRSIKLQKGTIKGTIRGLTDLNLNFDYPITAIAGKNGTGKSTILALVCCAYHNSKNGFKIPERRQSYYTFVDFFIQQRDEIPPQGIEISYGIAHDNWKKSERFPDGQGVGYQIRKKRKVDTGMTTTKEYVGMLFFLVWEELFLTMKKVNLKVIQNHFLSRQSKVGSQKLKILLDTY